MDFKYPYTDYHELNLDWFLGEFKNLVETWARTQQDWISMQEYIRDYFTNLNVQTEIDNKINAMILNGTFGAIVEPFVTAALPALVTGQLPDVVAAQIGSVVAAQIGAVVADQLPAIAAAAAAEEVGTWLVAHINPDTGYVIDDTLTVSRAAADAKTVGDVFTSFKNAYLMLATVADLTIGGAIAYNDGTLLTTSGYSTTYTATDYIDIPAGITKIEFCIPQVGSGAPVAGMAFYAADNTYISGIRIFAYYLGYGKLMVDIPDGAVKMRLCARNTEINTFYAKGFFNYVERYVNLLDPSTVRTGGYYSSSNGTWTSTSGISSTGNIPVIPGEYYIYSNEYNHNRQLNLSFWDADDNFVRGYTAQDYAVLYVPSDPTIKYMRANFASSLSGNIALYKSAEYGLPYSPYGTDMIFAKYGFFDNIQNIEKGRFYNKKAGFVGDSITYGYGTSAGHIYYQLLNNMIGFSSVYADGVAGSCYSVTSNYGTSTNPISQRYGDIPTDCDLVVLFAGTNDYGHNTPMGTIDDATDISFYGALNVIIDGIKTANPDVNLMLMTPTHRHGFSGTYPNETTNGQGYTLKDYVDAIRLIAEKYSVPVIDLYSNSGFTPAIAIQKTDYCPDGLHPNADGHQLIAEYMFRELK